jgi:hypothetical protein
MAVLFLHPLALGLLVGLFAYAWLVWRGTLRWWSVDPDMPGNAVNLPDPP